VVAGPIGWSRYASYDAILVAAAAPEIPRPLLEQMSPEGGRMLVPVGTREMQSLVLVRRRGDEYVQEDVLDCTFVPLLGRFGWIDEGPLAR
jgi:protein-L-isoaspartate(D-aspartate) O-methyltransferase